MEGVPFPFSFLLPAFSCCISEHYTTSLDNFLYEGTLSFFLELLFDPSLSSPHLGAWRLPLRSLFFFLLGAALMETLFSLFPYERDWVVKSVLSFLPLSSAEGSPLFSSYFAITKSTLPPFSLLSPEQLKDEWFIIFFPFPPLRLCSIRPSRLRPPSTFHLLQYSLYESLSFFFFSLSRTMGRKENAVPFFFFSFFLFSSPDVLRSCPFSFFLFLKTSEEYPFPFPPFLFSVPLQEEMMW